MIEPRRILIVGGPGTGKSHLANKLGALLDVVPTDLRVLTRELIGGPLPSYWRTTLAKDLAIESQWIAEGTFIGWTEPLMEAADLIVWLDFPRLSALRSVVTNPLCIGLRRQPPTPGHMRFIRYLRWVNRYHRTPLSRAPDYGPHIEETRALTDWVLRDFRHKVTVCHSKAGVAALIRSLAVAPLVFNRS